MDCSCDIELELDGPYASFCKRETPVARKLHLCFECGKQIYIGEQYVKITGNWDGEFCTYKTCNDCESLKDQFMFNGYQFGLIREDIVEFINCADGEVPEDCIVELTPGAKEWVCEEIEEYWERKTLDSNRHT